MVAKFCNKTFILACSCCQAMKRVREESENSMGLQQAIAFDKCIKGFNVFLSGSAGTGKTEVIKNLKKHWLEHGKKFALTATTGIAGLHIGGKTLHSFLCLRPEDDDASAAKIYERLSKNDFFSFFKRQMKDLDVLVIDEVSMMSQSLFETASELFQLVRVNAKPFGGLQIILVGDFFQLGPVQSKLFLFESPEFTRSIQETVILKEIFRQTDPVFSKLLSRMRIGALSPDDIECLQSRVSKDITCFGIQPTELWCTNKAVDKFNDEKLAQIDSEAVKFEAVFTFEGFKQTSSDQEKRALDSFKKERGTLDISLKKGPEEHLGAQVILTFNLDQEKGLVNGSRGLIIDFKKSESGASSKHLFGADYKSYFAGCVHPLVRFIVHDKPVQVLMPYVRLTKETKDHRCFVWHLPLKLAWATTIHKSQGLSLDRVRICLDSTVFADGQAYVACSRARTLEGLTFSVFDPNTVKANAKVIEFYKKFD